MPGKITEYNPYIRNKLLQGFTISEALDKWKKYKKTKKGSRSCKRTGCVKTDINKSLKNTKSKKKVGSRTKRKPIKRQVKTG